ncbi:MAG: peroxiredoxin family protein [Pyrinomonadaceae bacterium]
MSKIIKIFNKHFFLGVGAGILLTILLIIGAGLLLAKMFYTAENLQSSIGAPPFPSNDPVDYDWTVKSLDGRDVSIADLRGKVVVLNFWATWCLPCIAEMPSLQRLYEKTKDEGVMIVCISPEESETVARFVKEKGYTFPVYTLSGDPPAVFKSEIVPTTFILSSDGKVAFKHAGAAKWDDEKSVDFLRSLLK